MKNMNICIVAGGTGGHIYPALALASKYYELGHNIYYIGNESRMEAKLVRDKTPYVFLSIKNDGLRKGFVQKVKALLSQIKAIKDSRNHLMKHKIDIVIGFGGYVTFPVCIAAQRLNIPYFLHEQNAIPGKANLYVEKKAKGIVVCYEKAKGYFKNKNTVLLGNPRASEVVDAQKNDDILLDLNLNKQKPLIYIVMGSLGSKPFYKTFIEMVLAYNMSNYQFVISTGVRDISEFEKEVSHLQHVNFYKFVDQVSILQHADLVISRSGATSVAEIMASGVPSILIPSPYVTNNHQFYNAAECVAFNAALMIEDKDVTSENLFNLIQSTMSNQKLLETLRFNTQKVAFKESRHNIIKWIDESIHG